MVGGVTGAVLAAIGLVFVWLAYGRKRRAEAMRRDGSADAQPALHPSLALMADVGPPIIYFGLVVVALQVALAFWATRGAGGAFTELDLAGFLVLLVGYGVWVKAKTTYRVVTPPRRR